MTKAKRILKPGLVLPLTRVEIQDVTTRHEKTCATCGEQPQGRRLVIKVGSGRGQKQEIFCVSCGREKLLRMAGVMAYAMNYLSGASEAPRLLLEAPCTEIPRMSRSPYPVRIEVGDATFRFKCQNGSPNRSENAEPDGRDG